MAGRSIGNHREEDGDPEVLQGEIRLFLGPPSATDGGEEEKSGLLFGGDLGLVEGLHDALSCRMARTVSEGCAPC